jgi:hypothetical protein
VVEIFDITYTFSMNSPEDIPAECAVWLVAVDRVMKRDWYIDTSDAGLSTDEIIRFWQTGETPEEFVLQFAKKRALFDFNNVLR